MMNQNTNTNVIPYNVYRNPLCNLINNAVVFDGCYVIVLVPRELLAWDEKYQRPGRYTGKLRREFDPNKMDPLLVSPHYEEGKAYIIDGYGRYIVTGEIDPDRYAYLVCKVLLNVPQDPVLRRKFEAEMFAYQNNAVSKITFKQKFKALIAMGDSTAVELLKIISKYGFYIRIDEEGSVGKGRHKSFYNKDNGKYELYNAETLYKVLKIHGADALEYILEVLERTGAKEKTDGYSRYMISGIKTVWSAFPSKREEAKKFLVEMLLNIDPNTFKAKAVSNLDGIRQGDGTCVNIWMQKLVADKFGYEFEITKDKVVMKTA